MQILVSSSNKEAIVVIGIITFVFFIVFTPMYFLTKSLDDQDALERAACKALDAKYGEYFTPKTGPFRDVKMKAVDFTSHLVILEPIDSTDRRHFLCKDLKRFE